VLDEPQPFYTYRFDASIKLSVMKNIGIVASGFLLLLFSTASLSGQISATSLIAEIGKSTPEAVIQKYFETPEWQEILQGIGTGEDNWLKVYVELRRGSDGAAGEELSAALWDKAVLAEPFKVFAIERYDSCEFTFEAECPQEGVGRYLDRLELSLGRASTPGEHKMKNRCLVGIKKTRAVFSKPKAYCSL
jgi:hypothetical protein